MGWVGMGEGLQEIMKATIAKIVLMELMGVL